MSTTLEQLLDVHRRVDLARLRHEPNTLHEIRAWAICQAGIDFGEGDTVEIVGELNTDNGWSPYREALPPGATGTVKKICFSPAFAFSDAVPATAAATGP